MTYLFGQDHVDRYIATDGEEGHDWREGSKVLLLTATGRKSGRQIVYPLIYGRNGGDYLLVASKGGAPQHPSWYLNLDADPDVEIQVKGDKMHARARTATPEEKAELWPIMTEEWPAYDDYQGKTDRDIPVVVVTPTGS
jgi:deazaflavin-dependent oxidoreductase (nitroreductase family)